MTDCAGAINNLDFTEEELAEIDRLSSEEEINIWAASTCPTDLSWHR